MDQLHGSAASLSFTHRFVDSIHPCVFPVAAHRHGPTLMLWLPGTPRSEEKSLRPALQGAILAVAFGATPLTRRQ